MTQFLRLANSSLANVATLSLCFLFYLPAEAQVSEVQDSLIQYAESGANDSLRVRAYIQLAYSYSVSDSAQTMNYGEKAVALAESIHYPEGVVDAMNEMGWVIMMYGHQLAADQLFSDMIRYADSVDYNLGKAKAYYAKGIVFNNQGAYSKALDSYFQSLDYYVAENHVRGQANCFNAIGAIYRIREEYDQAINYYSQSLEIKKKAGDKEGMAYTYNNMGVAAYYQKQYEQALEYYFKALELFDEDQDKSGIADIFLNVGEVYMELERYEESLDYYQRSLDLYRDITYGVGESYALIGLGKLARRMQNLEVAKRHLEDALKVSRSAGYAENVREGAQELTLVERSLGNFKAALEAQDLYVLMTDSLNNRKATQEIARLEAEYEFQQEQDSINFINEREKLALNQTVEQQRNFQVLTFMVALFLFIVLFILYRFYRSKQKSNRKLLALNQQISEQRDDLEKLNQAKTRFFSIVAHDLRGPLSVFIGYYDMIKEQIQQKLQNDQHVRALSLRMDQAGEQMLNLLDMLLKWALKEEGMMPYNPERLNLRDCVAENMEMQVPKAESKEIKLRSDIPVDLYVWADRNSLMTILRNLTSNALKFTHAHGEIRFSGASKGHSIVELNVKDTGIGIAKEKMGKLFDINETKVSEGTKGEKGSGLGLNIVHDFVKMNKGSVLVESEQGEGTTFTILLPAPNAGLF
jgi:signal transduction histidine kinase